jgi:hypothetical protein
MRKMMNVLAGSAVALALGAGFAASSNAQDLSKDEAYCRALVNVYRGGGHGLEGWSESLDLSVADDQCWNGNPEPAIPVLEKRLRDMGYTLPPRT